MRMGEEIGRGRKSDAGRNRTREEIGCGKKSDAGGNRRRMSGGSGAVYFGREAGEKGK
ncbi:unknown [Acetobacter sp. CAG:267]|nr:unknown [Acetobacter sp. CAG:267]